LVVIGADLEGKKRLIPLDEVMAESEESRPEVLHDLNAARSSFTERWRLPTASRGFWAAVSSVYPQAAQRRYWLHKIQQRAR